MILKPNRTVQITGSIMLSVLLVVSFSGCIGALSQLMYVIKGHSVPPDYDGLQGKRVAVVCISDVSAYGPDPISHTVTKVLNAKLAQGVKHIKVIPAATIENWIDKNGWDQKDFGALGRGVQADRIIAIQIGSFSIFDGATIHKGRAEITVTVYDLEQGGEPYVAYSYGPQDYVFPKNGRPAIQTPNRQFESFFLAQLIESIGRHFLKHDRLENFASDAIMDDR